MSNALNQNSLSELISPQLTQREIEEIKRYLALVNVCGECGKWLPILFYDRGICLKTYLDEKRETADKRHALQFSCDDFIYWEEIAGFLPTKKTQEIIIEAKQELFKTGVQLADALVPKLAHLDEY